MFVSFFSVRLFHRRRVITARRVCIAQTMRGKMSVRLSVTRRFYV